MCRESKGLINIPDKLGRSPLLVGLMAGAGVQAVTELIKQGESCQSSRDSSDAPVFCVQERTPQQRMKWVAALLRLQSSTVTLRYIRRAQNCSDV